MAVIPPGPLFGEDGDFPLLLPGSLDAPAGSGRTAPGRALAGSWYPAAIRDGAQKQHQHRALGRAVLHPSFSLKICSVASPWPMRISWDALDDVFTPAGFWIRSLDSIHTGHHPCWVPAGDDAALYI